MNIFSLKVVALVATILIANSPKSHAILSATIGSQSFVDGAANDSLPLSGQVGKAMTTENFLMVTAFQGLSKLSQLDLNVSEVRNISLTSRTLTLSTENLYTLAGPTAFTAHLGGKNGAGSTSYFEAYLGSQLVFDSRTFNGSNPYGAVDFSGNDYVVPGTFGVGGGTYNLKLIAHLDVAVGTKSSFNFGFELNPSAVPDGGATAAMFGLASIALVAIRRKIG